MQLIPIIVFAKLCALQCGVGFAIGFSVVNILTSDGSSYADKNGSQTASADFKSIKLATTDITNESTLKITRRLRLLHGC